MTISLADITLRPATRDDVPAILRLLTDDPWGSTRDHYIEPIPACYYEAFDEIACDQRQELLVAMYQRQIIGTFQLSYLRYLSYEGASRAQIESVRVHKDYRNQGIGRYLLEWAIARAKEKNCHTLSLTTLKERKAAHRFYERLGFKTTHEGMKLVLKP